MFGNYLATALSNLARNWLYAAISIFGLAVSFAGAILVAQFVRNEFSYDRWIPGYENVYKLIANLQQPGQPTTSGDIVQASIGQELKDQFPGVTASARLMQEGQELTTTFHAFEAERRPRAEKIVAIARRNGNNKREFSATGAWMRNQMMKWLLPLGSKGMDFMYAYDARAT